MKEFALQLSYLPYRYISGLFDNIDVSWGILLSTFLRLSRPLQYGKQLYQLKYSIITELLKYSLYQQQLQRGPAGPMFFFEQWQLISLATREECTLLANSLTWGIPHEVCQIRITTTSGEHFKSAIFPGGLFSFASGNKIEWVIDQLVEQSGMPIKQVEIWHTHPSIDFILETRQEESYLYLNGLSRADISLAQYLSMKQEYLVKIKAITHSQLSYSVAFRAGQIIKY